MADIYGDRTDLVAVEDPWGKGFLLVPEEDVPLMERVIGLQEKAGRGPSSRSQSFYTCIYRTYRLAQRGHAQREIFERFPRFPLHTVARATVADDLWHQCNEDCWPPYSNRVAQLFYKLNRSRREQIVLELLSNYDRVVEQPDNSVLDQMEAQAEEWDHELFMVPDRAIAPTFIFAGMLTRGKR